MNNLEELEELEDDILFIGELLDHALNEWTCHLKERMKEIHDKCDEIRKKYIESKVK